MTEDATQQPTVQKDRKAHESFNVQRLTTWVGAAALSLSGIFTAFAAKGAPMTIGVAMAASVQPGAAVQNQVSGALDRGVVAESIDRLDAACSRFREDSDLSALNRAAGAWVAVDEVLLDALEAAVWAARVTEGAVDPTVGRALRIVGYDRDFTALPACGGPIPVRAE